MTHEISITQTDFGQYPLPGVNNDTQGFRDRFSLIQDKFDILDEAVNTLELVAVKKNEDNDFNGGHITDAILRGSGWASINVNTGLAEVDFDETTPLEIRCVNANYFSYIVSAKPVLDPPSTRADAYIRFSNVDSPGWPLTDGMMSKMTVELTANETAKDVVFMPGPTPNILKLEAGFGGVPVLDAGSVLTNNVRVTISANTTNVYEFWTADKGITVFARLIGTFS